MSKAVFTVLTATALLAAAAAPASATDSGADPGRASASVLRAALDVGLLNKTVHVPLSLTLNEVTVPDGGREKADRTALTAHLDGVDKGRPFSVLRADVARTTATVDKKSAEAEVELLKTRVHVPGLPLLSLIEVDAVTARAHCAVGERPVAEANPLTTVKLLGRRTTLSSSGPTHLKVPGVGEVKLELARTETTSRTAAASALDLSVSVNPLNLNVAEVEGRVTLAEASCRTPRAAKEVTTEEKPEKPQKQAPEQEKGAAPQTERRATEQTSAEERKDEEESPRLAATGGDSRTPYLLGSGAALFAIGGTLLLARRRRA
ncbi:SCO1860 family LAETG-anchored protein [Streptomyces tardus]|uniref:SCO1860 family LAETG-anchored protein n=1 Tax=Streptomyces tardus TaxID=2780544 RepID=UPI0027E3C74D|nr:SCO1860 family LAETG-anchored protein [Streptomyces tardus]